MKAGILSFSKQGFALGTKVAQALSEIGYTANQYTTSKFASSEKEEIVGGLTPFTGQLMASCSVVVFIGAVGIGVRSIAPFIRHKTVDPAVIAMDDGGKFVISLLSGHIGGGNRLTDYLAHSLNSTPVITTATDLHGRFSVDSWAVQEGYVIDSLKEAKRVSAEILERDVAICSYVSLPEPLANGLTKGDRGEVGISLSYQFHCPFEHTLLLVPKVLRLGIGCRRGTSIENIALAVDTALKDANIDFRSVVSVSSVTLKADEEGLLSFCQQRQLPITFYTPEQLMAVEGNFTSSAFVQSVVGVDNVCERSAMAEGNCELILQKTSLSGVTVAVAQQEWEVHFA